MRRDEEQALRALRSLGHSLAGTVARARRWRARASEIGVRVMDELVSRLAGYPIRTRPKDLLRRAAQLGAGVLETTLVENRSNGASASGLGSTGLGPTGLGPTGRSAEAPAGADAEPAGPEPDSRARSSADAGGVQNLEAPEPDADGVLLLVRDPEWAYISWRFSYDLIGRRAAGMRGAEARLHIVADGQVWVDEAVTPARGRYFFPWPPSAPPQAAFTARVVVRGRGGREAELGRSAPVRPGLEVPPGSGAPRRPEAATRWLSAASGRPEAARPEARRPSSHGTEQAPGGSKREAVASFAAWSYPEAVRWDGPGAARPSFDPSGSASAFGAGSMSSAIGASASASASASWTTAFGSEAGPASSAPASVAPGSLAPASVAPASVAPASVAPASVAPASGAAASWGQASSAGASWGQGFLPASARGRRTVGFGAEGSATPLEPGARPWPFDPERLARLVDPRARYRGPEPGGVSADAIGFGIGRPRGVLVPVLHDPLEEE